MAPQKNVAIDDSELMQPAAKVAAARLCFTSADN